MASPEILRRVPGFLRDPSGFFAVATSGPDGATWPIRAPNATIAVIEWLLLHETPHQQQRKPT